MNVPLAARSWLWHYTPGSARASWAAGDARIARARWNAGAIMTSAQSVRDLKVKIDAEVLALDGQIGACADKIPAPMHAAWQAFVHGWSQFRDSPDDWWLGFGTGPIYDQALNYDSQVAAWQKQIAPYCASVPGPPPFVPEQETQNEQGPFGSEAGSVVKTVAIAGAVVVGGIVLLSVLPEVKAAGRMVRSRR